MKALGKFWGKGGRNAGNIGAKTITGSPLSEHEKQTLRDIREGTKSAEESVAQRQVQEAEQLRAEVKALEAQTQEANARTAAAEEARKVAEHKVALAKLDEPKTEPAARQSTDLTDHGGLILVLATTLSEQDYALADSSKPNVQELMENLAQKVLSGQIKPEDVRLSRAEYEILEQIVVNSSTKPGTTSVVPREIDTLLNIIEAQIENQMESHIIGQTSDV